MKSKLMWLLLVGLLPVISQAQNFNVHKLSLETDNQFLAAEIAKNSSFIQKLQAAMYQKADISDADAIKLVEEKLKELNNEELNKMYAQASSQNKVQWGAVIYLLFGGLSGGDDMYDSKLKFGGGFGLFAMWILGKLIVMPELVLLWQGFGEEYQGLEYKATFMRLALSVAVLYLIQLQNVNLVVGLSPTYLHSLSGKQEFDGEKEDIDFDDEEVNRGSFGLGFQAGIMLKNYMMIRLIYNLGFSKLYDDDDDEHKLYFWALAFNIPFSIFGGGGAK